MVAPMTSGRTTLEASSFTDFGTLLRVLRHRARMTQRDLGIAVGYSEAQISRLEKGRRLPEPTVVAALFLPALRLGHEPELAARLHELAVEARKRAASASPPEPPAPPGAAPRTASAGPPTDAGDLAAVPSTPSHHVQRTAALADLRDLIGAERRVLMSGLPGVGKTSLAAALARQTAEHGAVCWVTLTAGITTSSEALIRLLARFLVRHGHEEAAPVCDPGQVEQPLPRDEQVYLITKAMSQADALICLDNAHLLRDEPQTTAMIEHLAGSASAFLAVSREDLPLSGFTPFRLAGLDYAEARELVGELAGPLMPAPLADTLIERARGSPMLIRLALGQLRPGGPGAAAVIDRLEAEPGVVSYLLQATLGDLSEPSRRLISLIAVFRHPVDLLDERLIDASESAGGRYDVLAGLDELRRRQLVDHPARADLHPLVRDYCYARLLGAASGRRQLHRLAAQHCERVLDDPLEATWHYLRAGDPAEAVDLLATRTADLVASGRSGHAADLAAELLAAGELTGDGERRLLIARGDLLLHTERAGEAESAYQEALTRPAPPVVQAEVAWRLAQSLMQRGKVPEALDLCRSTAAGLTGDEEVLRAQLGAVRSRAHLMLSEFGEAVSVAEEACTAADRFADVAPDVAGAVRARTYWVLGVVARLRGRPDEATGWLRRSAAAARQVGLRDVAGRALFNLGATVLEQGDGPAAEQLFEEALAEARPIGDRYVTARILHTLGMLRQQAGKREEAIKLFEDSYALNLRMGDPLGASSSEHALALILLSQGRTEVARALLAAIVTATESLGERRARAYHFDSLGMVDLVDGDHRNARRHFAESARIAAEVDNPSLRTSVGVHNALAVLASGDLAAAARLTADCAEQLAGAGTGIYVSVPIEYAALAACLALATGDLEGAATSVAEMDSLASKVGDVRYVRAAQRIAAAIRSTTDGSPPALTRLPRLLWVADGP
jgi:ATP/maltotriose-dependent transcriptional regulator MalT/DNA-binding XRE family transcriptional regulator